MKIKLPSTVKAVLDALHAAGFEAFAVGGCVRDSILGRNPDDWDITTSALPDQIKNIFRRTVDTGIAHGTVTVLMGSAAHEVTTYRIDGEYQDARHPKEVTFTSNLEEDLKRRDFTINAMAYSEETGLVDLHGGMEDLQKKVIRCVGDPNERFTEDALRIMRAVRFSAQLHFGIDPATREAVKALAPNLSKISAERICTELVKLVTSDHPEFLKIAWETGITKVVLPEFDRMMETPQNNRYHCFNVGDHTLKAMQCIGKSSVERLTMLLHDVAKPDCRKTDPDGTDHFKMHGTAGAEQAVKILRRLKMDNKTISDVKTLVLYHSWRMNPEETEIRHAINRVGRDLFPALIRVQIADAKAKAPECTERSLARIQEVITCYERILSRGDCVSLKELQLNGKDLMNLGLKPGPGIGEVLNEALEIVLAYPEKNQKELLLAWAEERIAAK